MRCHGRGNTAHVTLDRADEARAIYRFLQRAALPIVLVGIAFHAAGWISLVNLIVAGIGMVGVYALSTWQLRRETPWQAPRRRERG
jgi:hypothetical protein